MSTAVEILKKQFPNVPENTIQNVLQNQCNGDTNQAIVILMRIEEFNRSMNIKPQPAAVQQVIIQQPAPVAVQQQIIQQPVPLQVLSPAQIPLKTQSVEGTDGNASTSPVQQQVQVIRVQQPIQQIPLQIISPNNSLNNDQIKASHPYWSLNLDSVQGQCCMINCPCCMTCCPSCFMIPDKYDNGLYLIDLKMKNISFIIFILCSIFGEYKLLILNSPIQTYCIPLIALVLIFIASVLFYFSDRNNSIKLNKILAIFYFVGGLLYFVSYCGYAFTVKSVSVCDFPNGQLCHCDSYGWDDDCTCSDGTTGHDHCDYSWGYTDWTSDFVSSPPYFIMRGLFIFYHCIMMYMHYYKPICTTCNDRLSLIKLDSVMLACFAALTLSWAIPHGVFFAFNAAAPVWMTILFLTNTCIAQPITNNGGCTGFSITGIMLIIFYFFYLIVFFSVSLDQTVGEEEARPNIFNWGYWFWQFGAIFAFSIINFWIYLRMIHPTFASCCAKKIQQDHVVAI